MKKTGLLLLTLLSLTSLAQTPEERDRLTFCAYIGQLNEAGRTDFEALKGDVAEMNAFGRVTAWTGTILFNLKSSSTIRKYARGNGYISNVEFKQDTTAIKKSFDKYAGWITTCLDTAWTSKKLPLDDKGYYTKYEYYKKNNTKNPYRSIILRVEKLQNLGYRLIIEYLQPPAPPIVPVAPPKKTN